MSVYLHRILEWLGKYNIPTIVLSATLPSEKSRQFIELYSGIKTCPSKAEAEYYGIEEVQKPDWMTSRAYPLITYSNGDEICSEVIPGDGHKTTIEIEKIHDDALECKLDECMKTGGCAGIIVNSVRRAQAISKRMREIYCDDKVLLFHSRFLMPDRAEIEKQITAMLGKPSNNPHRPEFKIIIGTQVLEQSLDIDFDVLFTDLAPMDLLIQRMGRLHRHHRTRPELLKSPKCFVMGLEDDGRRASTHIYDNYLLMRTEALLPNQMTLPNDISQYVEDTYHENTKFSDLDEEEYKKACKQYQNGIDDKEAKAKVFCLQKPNLSRRLSTLNGWLNCDCAEQSDRAVVRDIVDSIEVYLIQKKSDGYIYLINNEHTMVSGNETPNDELAREILKYRIDLPVSLIQNYDETISELEICSNEVSLWQKSRWLKGNLFLILNEKNQFTGLPGIELTYSKTEGLSYTKKERTNA